MSFNDAYTVPFPKDSKITVNQAFEALRLKCRDPTKFIAAFTACEVLEETPRYIKRRVTTRDGRLEIEEIDLYAPTMAIFKSHNGESVITNIVSESEDGGLLLTFTFQVKDVTLFFGTLENALVIAKAATRSSMKAILEMFERGELN